MIAGASEHRPVIPTANQQVAESHRVVTRRGIPDESHANGRGSHRRGPRRVRRTLLLRPARHRQFQDFACAGRGRCRADFRTPRMQRSEHGRRLRQGDRRADIGERAFRSGADQCADRDRRGGEEPNAACRAGRRRADWRGEEQLLHRAGRNRARGRCGVGAAAYAELRA